MKRLTAKSTVVVAAMALTMFGGATGAGAMGVGGAVGTVSFSPQLTGTAQNTAVTFYGTAIGLITAPTVAAGTCNVQFQGNGFETVTVGLGSGTLTCGGGTWVPGGLSISCQVSYERAYAVVTVSGGCGVAGSLTALCVFAPTSNPPQSYALACGFAST
jgi:hypothetical protein